MNNSNKYIFSLLLLAFVSVSTVFGQIRVDTVGKVSRFDTTEYSDPSLLNDPIYYLYTPDPKGHDIGGDIIATYNNVDTVDYKWYKFNYATNLFDNEIFIDRGLESVYSKQVFDTGGYRVNVTNALGLDTNYYAWVFFNELNVRIPIIEDSDCDKMNLKAMLKMDNEFAYRDKQNLDSILYKKNERDSIIIECEGSADYTGNIGVNLIIYNKDVFITVDAGAPTKPVKFTVKATDRFGKTASSYIEIGKDDPIDDLGNTYLRAVKSDFIASRTFLGDSGEETDSTGQAPMNVQFVNKSENAIDYRWVFYTHVDRDVDRYNPDSIKEIVESDVLPDSILYTFPSSYDVKLVVKGPVFYDALGDEYQCSSELIKQEYIKVDSVFMPEFMNVFTPNGDGLNDKFYFVNYPTPGESSGADFKTPRSIKDFSIKIYSRWGTKVYFYEGSAENWQGWDGKSGITNGTVKTGVYYYQAIFEGYDGSNNKERNGFVHVFR